MAERYMKTVEEHLRKVVGSHQRDRDERLPLYLLAYRASTHDTTGLTPALLVFGRDLRLPSTCYSERPTTDHAAGYLNHLHDIHVNGRQHLKLASDRMKNRYDELANSAGYHEGDRVWLYRQTSTKGKSPKLQSSWEGPYKVITRINDVV
jgi:hypothetical protein